MSFRKAPIDFTALFLLGLTACGPAREVAEAPSESAVTTARHVVLVTVDTLRADHLGVYGGDVATPHFDRLAREGVLVEQAVAHVPLTRPSHVALMSGLLPSVTGVRDNVSPSPIPQVPLLAEVLSAEGFETAGFVSAVVISRSSGLSRGFDHYSDQFDARPEDPRFLNKAQKPGDETVAEAMSWLASSIAVDDSRVFLWLHLYDPHEPYEPPEPYASRYADRPYAGEVAWTDELIGRVDAELKRLGVVDETLLVVTSDHGEGLGDHDELLHGFFAYESTLRVPLIARGPGIVPGSRLQAVAGLVDLYPTILDLVGVAVTVDTGTVDTGTVDTGTVDTGTVGIELSGRSLAATFRGGPELAEVPVYAETLVPRLKFGWSDLRVLREGRYKFIQAPRPELYDVLADPGELENLVQRERGRAGQMRDTLAALIDADSAAAQKATRGAAASPAPDLLEQLGALGYVGSVTASTLTPGADPKDKVAEFRVANSLLRAGLASLHQGDFAASIEHLEALLEQGVASSEIHLNLGRGLFALGRFKEAVEHLLEAAARAPAHAETWLLLAEVRLRLNDADGAVEALRTGQTQVPAPIGLLKEEARILRLAGRPAEAKTALESAIAAISNGSSSNGSSSNGSSSNGSSSNGSSSNGAFLRAGLSEVLRDLGDLEGATERLREAVELAPEGAVYWNSLGMLLGGTGKLAEAEEAFREAWRLDDTNHHHAFNLGLALLRQGNVEQARTFFERSLELAPDFSPAREQLAQLVGAGSEARSASKDG